MVNMTDGGGGRNVTPHELETFLPQGKTNGVYKSVEDGNVNGFDPFKLREVQHPTSDFETLAHLLKAALGTGILGMPFAFKYSGYVLGIFATIFTAIICLHLAYVLVKCAHILYYKTKRTQMSFAEVAEVAFQHGPKWGRSFAAPMKYIILVCLFLTYFGTLSVYSVIVARNLQQVIEHFLEVELNTRLLIAGLLIPCVFLCWIPNLKFLAPVSMIANICMIVGLGITCYYLIGGLSLTDRSMVRLPTLPSHIAIVIFAMEAIGVVMPLENNMENPTHMLGVCGVLTQGNMAVTFIYMLIGLLGYLGFGEATDESITLNLPVEEIPAQIVKVLIALAVYGTFGIQFFVCLEIIWNAVKEKCQKRPVLANYVVRTLLIVAAFTVAILVPTIAPFMGLIGAFCFSILGLIIPAIIEVIVLWEDGFGRCNWIAWKNLFCFAFGVLAMTFGTILSVKDIAKLYTG